jgi:hypothetical protein
MKTRHRLAAMAVTAVAAAGALTTALPAAAAPLAFTSCDLSVKLDELRAWDTNDKYNIIVWKASASASNDLQGTVSSGETEVNECHNPAKTSKYYWKIFTNGTFVHKGDGGFRNWAFYGSFTRDGETVHFFQH